MGVSVSTVKVSTIGIVWWDKLSSKNAEMFDWKFNALTPYGKENEKMA